MNEEPKSFWKRNRTGWLAYFLGGLVLGLALFVIVLLIGVVIRAKTPFFAATLFGVGGFVLANLVCFIRWVCCWRNLKRLAFGMACLVTLVALLIAEENWRGKRALEHFKQEWSARGEKFTWQEFVPAVPDDKNFALSSVVASSYETYFDRSGHEVLPRNTNVVDRLAMLSWRENPWAHQPHDGGWQMAKPTDLKQWQEFFRASPPPNSDQTNSFPTAAQPQSSSADVMLALSQYDSALNELRQASRLPESRFPLTYGKDNPMMILLPHLSSLKGSCRAVTLHAAAALELGQTDLACDDVRLAFRLADSLRTEPVLISHLVLIAMLQISLQPIYDGLSEHKWSDAQLRVLDAELGRLDLLADYQYTIRGERIFGINGLDYIRRSRDLSSFSANDYSPPANNTSKIAKWFSRALMPDGLFYQNELTMARMTQEFLLPMVNATNRLGSPAKIRELQKTAKAELMGSWSPYKLFAKMLYPAIEKSSEKFVRAQSVVDLARTAIALERCRLAHGSFPESLDALAPQFIASVPHDVIGGGPLKYRREADGTFTLYSIGWNEKDDGGVVVLTKGSSPDVDVKQGDWVWRYPKK